MNETKRKVSLFDALGIAFLAVAVRLGDSFLALLLQLLGVLAGVVMIWLVATGHTIVPILLAIAAWVLWWLGYRLKIATGQKPLDEAQP